MTENAEDQPVRLLNEDEAFCQPNQDRDDVAALWLIKPEVSVEHQKTAVKRLAERISREESGSCLSGALRKQARDTREFAFECWAPKGTLMVMNKALRRLEGWTVSQEKLDRRNEFSTVVEFVGSIVQINRTPDMSASGSSGEVPRSDSESSNISDAIEALNARTRESRKGRDADLEAFRARQAEQLAQQLAAEHQHLAAENQQLAAELERLRAQAPSNAR